MNNSLNITDNPCGISICKNIQSRCDKVIDNTDNCKLNYGQSTLQWMIKRLDIDRVTPDSLYISKKDPGDNNYTTASLLYNNIDAFNLDDNNNLSWSQYFSLLALTIIQRLHYFNQLTKAQDYPDIDLVISHLMTHHIAEAMEAVSISEMMFNEPCHKCYADELSTRKVYSLTKARQSINKLQIARDLQSDLIRFWSNGTFNNKTDAARRYFDFICKDGDAMQRDKIVRKFAKTINEYEYAINNIIMKARMDNAILFPESL